MNSKKVIPPPSYTCQDNFNDTISCIKFSPNPNMYMFAAGSWSGDAYLYSLNCQNGNISNCNRMNNINVSCPILDLCWSLDGQIVYLACADNTIKIWNVSQNEKTATEFASHKGPVVSICCNNVMNTPCVISASYDNSIIFWNAQNRSNMKQVFLPVHPVSICANQNLLAITCTTNAQIMDLNDFNMKSIPNWKLSDEILRKCALSKTNDMAVFGTDSCRVGCCFLNGSDSQNFTWKGHKYSTRNEGKLYTVTGVLVHSTNAVITCGDDGTLTIWDVYHKNPICKPVENASSAYNYSNIKPPISAMGLSPQENLLAYSVGYNWSKGDPNKLKGSDRTEYTRITNKIYLQYITNEMVAVNRP